MRKQVTMSTPFQNTIFSLPAPSFTLGPSTNDHGLRLQVVQLQARQHRQGKGRRLPGAVLRLRHEALPGLARRPRNDGQSRFLRCGVVETSFLTYCSSRLLKNKVHTINICVKLCK